MRIARLIAVREAEGGLKSLERYFAAVLLVACAKNITLKELLSAHLWVDVLLQNVGGKGYNPPCLSLPPSSRLLFVCQSL